VWDANRVYRQAVILVSFSDLDFKMDDPQAFYDSLFNFKGFNKGKGPGCVADYFRDQSSGMFNLKFDVYGPIKMTTKQTGNGKYGSSTFHDAAEKVRDSLEVDFSPYDWNGDGLLEQVVYIYAGAGGNEAATEGSGYIWPNTSTFTKLTVGNVKLSNYTASAELWSIGSSCGIGTICHEFSHSLGLPDLYPTTTSSDEFSVVDEWDLMDGGNFTNTGWCPCNYSAYEKNLLGWLSLEELTEPTTITLLQPLSEGGKAYLISHTDKEFLVLENRQWTGWDKCTPGRGLLIAHVDDMKSAGNYVNNIPSHHRYDYFHADGLNYDEWEKLAKAKGFKRVNGHSPLLQSTPYPLLTDTLENHALTDETLPATEMFNENAEGSRMLSKPITDIHMTEDGLVSFNFMGGTLSVIGQQQLNPAVETVYALDGRQAMVPQSRRIYIVRSSDGQVRKIVK
jgi:M6 family metalloprotease-like protein